MMRYELNFDEDKIIDIEAIGDKGVLELKDCCNIMNEQKSTIQSLKEEKGMLQEEIKRLEKMMWKIQWRFQQEVGIEKAKEHYREIDKEMEE